MTIPLERPEGTRTTYPLDGGPPTEPVRPRKEAAAHHQLAYLEAVETRKRCDALILAQQTIRDAAIRIEERELAAMRVSGITPTIDEASDDTT
jgi:hypothetical protein